jgi:hypothetical protein
LGAYRLAPSCAVKLQVATDREAAASSSTGSNWRSSGPFVTASNRKARFYALTPAGKKQLAAEKREWNRMVTTMQAILNEPS